MNQQWRSTRWEIHLNDPNGAPRVVPQERPFALIGSHPACDLVIPGKRIPEVAYLVCCFPDAIEVWPLCALAFSRWGKLSQRHHLLIGSYQVRFTQLDDAVDDSASAAEGTTGNALSLVWKNHRVERKLTRRVSILGGNHPSTIRLHGQAMRDCDHGIVHFDNRIWMIDLLPRPIGQPSFSVHEMVEDGTYYQVGNLQVAVGDAQVEPSFSIAQRQERSSFRPDEEAISEPDADQAGTDADLDGVDDTGDSEFAEELTSSLTHRLVSIGRARKLREKILIWTALVLVMALMLVALGYLATLLFPLLVDLSAPELSGNDGNS